MNRFVTQDGKDVSYLASGNLNKPLVERNIHRGDTTYVGHGDVVIEDYLDLYKSAFADGDKAY